MTYSCIILWSFVVVGTSIGVGNLRLHGGGYGNELRGVLGVPVPSEFVLDGGDGGGDGGGGDDTDESGDGGTKVPPGVK